MRPYILAYLEVSLKYTDWRLNHHFNNTLKRITEWLSCLKTSNTFAIFQLCISKQGLMFYSPLICCIQYQLVSVLALAWCLIFYPLHKPDIFIEVQSFNIWVQNIKCFNYGGGLVFWDKIFILPKINTKILSVQPPLRKYLNPMDGIENLYFVDRYFIYVLNCRSVYLLFWQDNEGALLDTVFWQILSNSSWLVSMLSTDRESGSINSPTRNGATNGLNSLQPPLTVCNR